MGRLHELRQERRRQKAARTAAAKKANAEKKAREKKKSELNAAKGAKKRQGIAEARRKVAQKGTQQGIAEARRKVAQKGKGKATTAQSSAQETGPVPRGSVGRWMSLDRDPSGAESAEARLRSRKKKKRDRSRDDSRESGKRN